MLTQREQFELVKRLKADLAMNARGDALASMTRGFLRPGHSQLDDLARFLALVSTTPSGSFEGIYQNLLEEARDGGQVPRVHHRTAIRSLRPQTAHDLFPLLNLTNRAIWDVAWAEYRDRTTYHVQIDEVQRGFQGVGSKWWAQAFEFRKHAKTQSGLAVVPAKDTISGVTHVAHEWIIMTGTMDGIGVTNPLAAVPHLPLKFDKGKAVGALLQWLRTYRPRPRLVTLDRGFVAYPVLAELVLFNQDVPTCDFMMPAIVAKKGAPQSTESMAAMTGLHALAKQHWRDAQQIMVGGEETGHFVHVLDKQVRDRPDLPCKVLFHYYPTSAGMDNHGRWVFGRDVNATPFYVNINMDLSDPWRVLANYGLRWNCENFYKRLKQFWGVSPSDSLVPRFTTLAMAVAAMGVYGLFRVKSGEEVARDDRDELLRMRPFFHRAHQQLYGALSPQSAPTRSGDFQSWASQEVDQDG